MIFFLALFYLFIAAGISYFIYFWSAVFKVVGDSSMEEFNEEEANPDDMVDETETNVINHFGTFVFIILGVLAWTFMGLFVGKIADDLTDHFLLKYLSYFFLYFFFLRLPFGVLNKSIVKSHGFPHFPEKYIFALVMLLFYVVGVLLADKVPHFSEWSQLIIG